MVDVQLLTFIVVAAALTISPGADTMLVIRNVVAGNRRDGIMTAAGICSGLFVHATLSALGLSVILAHSALAFQVLKVAGAAYLVWLGLQSLARAFRRGREGVAPAGKTQRDESAWHSFVEGLLTNVLNPKVAVFYLAFLPQFINVGDPVFAKSLLLAGIHATMGLVWLIALVTMLDRARSIVARPHIRRRLEAVSGTVLIGLGVRLALSER
ncbi:MAG: LysE family translocator [Acidiferrobacterales bacterium]|nr:LysE family translocator [Gammaproteobacteria bacterium]